MAETTPILIETHGKVGVVRINRPKVLNALDDKLVNHLMDALAEFDRDDNIGAMIVTGDDRAFAAGADIKEMMDASEEEMNAKKHIASFDRITEIKKPIIAAVSGWCLGGGNELAISCDMIIASETAQFGQPEINLGVIPGAGATQRLTRALGKVIAMEMALNNRTLSAEEALKFGLVNHVYPVERYFDEAMTLAAQIAERAPVAVRTGKAIINLAFETSLEEGIAEERKAFYALFSTEDQKEGMKAFAEKRKPKWKGK